MRSIGFLVDPKSGVTVEKASFRAPVSSYSLTPYFSQASVAMTPMPPPLVTMTVFSPEGKGVLARNLHQLKASSTLSARKTPHWRMMASKISSEPASDPVWEAAAMAPRCDRPDLMTTTGIFGVVIFTARMSRSPSRTPSMYMRMILVCSSVDQVLQKVGFVHVGLVPDGDDGRKADVLHRGLADHGDAQGAALGDDRHPARNDPGAPEGGV